MALSLPVSMNSFDNVRYFGKGTFSKPQIVLPVGKGIGGVSNRESILSPNGTVIGGATFITHSNFPNTLQAIGDVHNIWIKGTSWSGEAEHFENNAIVHHGIGLFSEHSIASGVKVSGFRGTGIRVRDNVIGNEVFNCYTGIQTCGSDIRVMDNLVWACRDVVFDILPNNSQIQSSGNHYFGINGQTVGGVFDGKCIQAVGTTSIGLTGDTYEASHYGYYGNGDHYVRIVGCQFQRLTIRSLFTNGSMHVIVGCMFYIPVSTDHEQFDDTVGVVLVGNRNTISASMFQLSDDIMPGTPGTQGVRNVATALRVSGHQTKCMDCIFQNFNAPVGKSRAIHLVGGVTGFTANPMIWGYEGSGDVVLAVDSNTIKGVRVEIHGNSIDSPGFNPADIGQYVNIPSGWDSTNCITLIDDATGQFEPAVVGQTY
jgi:hypothetical protein